MERKVVSLGSAGPARCDCVMGWDGKGCSASSSPKQPGTEDRGRVATMVKDLPDQAARWTRPGPNRAVATQVSADRRSKLTVDPWRRLSTNTTMELRPVFMQTLGRSVPSVLITSAAATTKSPLCTGIGAPGACFLTDHLRTSVTKQSGTCLFMSQRKRWNCTVTYHRASTSMHSNIGHIMLTTGKCCMLSSTG